MYRKGLLKIKPFIFGWRLVVIVLIILQPIHDKTSAFAERIQLDGFVAIINGRLILESDINFEAALMSLEKKQDASPDVDRKEILEKLIDRELLLDQSRRFALRTVTEAELTERINRMDIVFEGTGGREKFFRDNGIDELFWRIYIHNRIILENYIEQRFRAFARVSREQEDSYIANHLEELGLESGIEPGGAVPDNHHLRTIIRALLAEKIVQERIAEFIQDLRSTATIVYSTEEPESLSNVKQMVNG